MAFYSGTSKVLYFITLLRSLGKYNKEQCYRLQMSFVCYLHGELKQLLASFWYIFILRKLVEDNN